MSSEFTFTQLARFSIVIHYWNNWFIWFNMLAKGFLTLLGQANRSVQYKIKGAQYVQSDHHHTDVNCKWVQRSPFPCWATVCRVCWEHLNRILTTRKWLKHFSTGRRKLNGKETSFQMDLQEVLKENPNPNDIYFYNPHLEDVKWSANPLFQPSYKLIDIVIVIFIQSSANCEGSILPKLLTPYP